MSSRFFARQEHHLQYYLLKLAYNEVRIYRVVIMMAMMMNRSLDSRFSSRKNSEKKPSTVDNESNLSFQLLVLEMGESRKNPGTHHKESNL